jgi:hypothetical protein
MEAAMVTLGASQTLTAVEEAAIAAELAAAAEAEAASATVVEATPEVLELPPVTLEIQPATVVLAEQDVVTQPRTSRSTLVFGNTAQIGRAKAKKQSRQPKGTAVGMTADLFASETAVSQQLSLF